MKTLLTSLIFVLSLFVACESKTKGKTVSNDKPEISKEEINKLVSYFNKLQTFPVDMEDVEKKTGIPFKKRFSTESGIYHYGSYGRVSLSVSSVDGKRMLNQVEIEADPEIVPVPEMPPGVKFNASFYRYLPKYSMAGKLGESFYRYLIYPDQEEYKEVNGTDQRINSTKWEYRIDQKRGLFISEKEKEEFKDAVLGLLTAIKENRFEKHLEDFEKKFPKGRWGSHGFLGHSLTIVYFNDKKEGKHFGKHLEKDGLSEYVGLHFNPEQHAEFLFAKPYLFEFFGIEELDALQKPGMRPYAGLKDTGTPNPAPPIDEATAKAMLPDISAAGNRKGGLAYYNEPKYVSDGWNFWMPGFYPHDGKTVERYLKKDKYLSKSFEILFSRKK